MIEMKSPGMWFEGDAYQKNPIYSIESGKLPPVNYDEHVLRPHSLTHLETPAHTQEEGQRLGYFFKNRKDIFFGSTIVIKLKGFHYRDMGKGIYHWIISKDEIAERLLALKVSTFSKILISTEDCPLNTEGYHDPNYVLTLSQAAADYLVSQKEFHLYGTSWKSSDFCPGSVERPIHNTLFKKALILENLKLNEVPEGLYFMSAFPLPLSEASESPVVPILYSKEEIMNSF